MSLKEGSCYLKIKFKLFELEVYWIINLEVYWIINF